MKNIRVGAASLNQTPLAWTHNFNNIATVIRQAKEQQISVLCLPELCLTGYGCEDAFWYRDVQSQALAMLDKIVELTDGIIVSVGLPLVHHNALYNVAALIADGKLLGFVPKQHLASDGVHYESRWFKHWSPGVADVSLEPGDPVSIGDLIFNVGGIRIGFEICEDAWVADRPGVELSKRGVDIILNPSASHFAFDKEQIREQFVTEGSRAFRCTYIYANLLGNEAGRIIFDGATLVASGGTMLARGRRLAFTDSTLIVADVDINKTRTQQIQNGAFRPDFNNRFEITTGFSFNESTQSVVEPEANCSIDKYEEFSRAVALGLFDYMRKTYAKGFTVSLSGGADSAAVACLVYQMCNYALNELGFEETCDRLSILEPCKPTTNPSEFIFENGILSCVYQGTVNSSQETEYAALALADQLGARFMSANVEPIVQEYIRFGEQFAKRKLSWETDDLVLQNIQARVRSPGAWMIANMTNSILLCTSNRSEAAVGYATMDGDTSGGLAPIAGVSKAFILEWLQRISHYDNFSTLINILAMKPSAELRPSDQKQTDEQDLMPYSILDYIEELAIRDKQGPADIFLKLQKRFNKVHAARLMTYLKRFYMLWTRNQWKRERLAIAFHLDDRNLDPRSWCRFPILSGGFVEEIEAIIKK